MAQYRLRQQESRIQLAISSIIQKELKDPRLGFVSVTGVDLTRDLSYCKVYVSVYGDEESKKASLEALSSAQGFVRRELGKKVELRKLPEISFHFDESIERGAKINSILREIDEPSERK